MITTDDVINPPAPPPPAYTTEFPPPPPATINIEADIAVSTKKFPDAVNTWYALDPE